MPRAIRKVLIADRHPLYVEAVCARLRAIDPELGIAIAGTSEDIMAALHAGQFQALLLGWDLAGSEGFELLASAHSLVPSLPVLLLVEHATPELMQRAAGFGASGMLGKDAAGSEVHAALIATLEGRQWFRPLAIPPAGEIAPLDPSHQALSPAQLRVLRALSEGQSTKVIAAQLHLSEATVKSHLSAIFRRLNVSNRAQAILALRGLAGSGQRVA